MCDVLLKRPVGERVSRCLKVLQRNSSGTWMSNLGMHVYLYDMFSINVTCFSEDPTFAALLVSGLNEWFCSVVLVQHRVALMLHASENRNWILMPSECRIVLLVCWQWSHKTWSSSEVSSTYGWNANPSHWGDVWVESWPTELSF